MSPRRHKFRRFWTGPATTAIPIRPGGPGTAASVSWLIVHDVTLARKEINFSEWGGYYPRTRQRKLEWMERALRDEKMPPWSYRLMHPGSRLTDDDRAALERWIQSALATATTDKSNK
jgi:Haem-binding domain